MYLLLISLLSTSMPSVDIHSQVEAHVVDRFLQHYRSVDTHVEIDVVRVTGLVDGEADFTIHWPDEPPHGTVQLRITDDDGARGWVMMRIRHLEYAAHATRDIAAGETMTASDISYALVDRAPTRGRLLTRASIDQLLDEGEVVAFRRIRTDRPLRPSDVGHAPIVEVGSSIVMDYQRGGVHFRITSTAREPGSEGEAIRLYSPETRSTYRARITGPGSAQWIETL